MKFDKTTVAINRIMVQSMISEKAWAELDILEEDVRVALEELIVKGFISENDGKYSLTKLGEEYESGSN